MQELLELLDRLRKVAEELGTPVEKLSRTAWIEAGGDWSYERYGNWRWIRKQAAKPPDQVQEQRQPVVPDGHVVKEVSTYLPKEKQWVKTSRKEQTKAEIMEALMEALPKQITPRLGQTPAPLGRSNDDLLAVYPMGDPHIGMLSWAPETGEDFDLSIARRLTCGAIDHLVQAHPQTTRALIINLGDFFHADSYHGVTSRSGHKLDTDGRVPKVARVGMEILIYLVDRALEWHPEVELKCVPGNHDDVHAVWLAIAMDCYYRDEPRVVVDLAPQRFLYTRFGANLVGCYHGDGPKLTELESIMASDRAKDWGETRHRAWYTGHVHHRSVKEYRGCTVETFRTLAAKDAYAAHAGYRAGRDMNRIVLHREFGEIHRSTVSADYLEAQYRAAA